MITILFPQSSTVYLGDQKLLDSNIMYSTIWGGPPDCHFGRRAVHHWTREVLLPETGEGPENAAWERRSYHWRLETSLLGYSSCAPMRYQIKEVKPNQSMFWVPMPICSKVSCFRWFCRSLDFEVATPCKQSNGWQTSATCWQNMVCRRTVMAKLQYNTIFMLISCRCNICSNYLGSFGLFSTNINNEGLLSDQ